MGLKRALQILMTALSVPAHKRDFAWAHTCCKASRKVHEGVWELQIKADEVLTEILPLLENVKQEMDALRIPRRGKLRKYIEAFSRNVGQRIDNLRDNYVEGNPSAFAPSSLLEEVEALLKESEGSDMEPQALLDRLLAQA